MNYDAGQFDPGATIAFPVVVQPTDTGTPPSQAYYAEPYYTGSTRITSGSSFRLASAVEFPVEAAPDTSGLTQGMPCPSLVPGAFASQIRLNWLPNADSANGFAEAGSDWSLEYDAGAVTFSTATADTDTQNHLPPEVSVNHFSDPSTLRVKIGKSALASYLTPTFSQAIFVGSQYAYYRRDNAGNLSAYSNGPFSPTGSPNPGPPPTVGTAYTLYTVLRCYYLPLTYRFGGPLQMPPYGEGNHPPCCVAAHWDWIDGADRHYGIGDTPSFETAFTPALLSPGQDVVGVVGGSNLGILFSASVGVLPNPYKAGPLFQDADQSLGLLKGFADQLSRGGHPTTFSYACGLYSYAYSSPAAPQTQYDTVDANGNVSPGRTGLGGDLLNTTSILFTMDLPRRAASPLTRSAIAVIVDPGNYSPTPFRLRVDYVPATAAHNVYNGNGGGNVGWTPSPLIYDDGPRYLNVTLTNSPDPHEPPPNPPGGAYALAVDAHRRPLAALAAPLAATGALGYCSNDAGHSFAGSVIDADKTCADINLLVDRQQNRFRALYTKGAPGKTALYSAFGEVTDAFTPEAAPAAVGTLNGLFPVACQHPTERQAALLLLVVGGALVCAETGDGGATWSEAGTVAGSVDFQASGRPGLCFLGDTAFAAYASGRRIACAASEDRGRSWAACTAAGGNGPYSGLSLLGWLGVLYLLAFAAPPAAGDPPVPVLFVSGEQGASWTAGPALPPISLPSAIGVLPLTAQLRLGLSHKSDDDGNAWLVN